MRAIGLIGLAWALAAGVALAAETGLVEGTAPERAGGVGGSGGGDQVVSGGVIGSGAGDRILRLLEEGLSAAGIVDLRRWLAGGVGGSGRGDRTGLVVLDLDQLQRYLEGGDAGGIDGSGRIALPDRPAIARMFLGSEDDAVATEPADETVAPASARTLEQIRVLSWNVENLFDAVDDPENVYDDTYLPKAVKDQRPDHAADCEKYNTGDYAVACKTLDWSADVVAAKLRNLAAVIAPAGASVVILPETENAEIVKALNAELGDKAFRNVVALDSTSETEDRGIDVAILTNLDVASGPTAHKVDFGDQAKLCRGTRDIVEVELALPAGGSLTVFGVHLPSNLNDPSCRIIAFKALQGLRDRLPVDALVLAGGDFNFACEEAGGLAFLQMLKDGQWFVPPEVRNCTEAGSHKYQGRWSFLDFFLTSRQLQPNSAGSGRYFANPGSFRNFLATPEQTYATRSGAISPRRFNPKTGSGTSDHWPVAMELIAR